jgi:hypothetical protein
MEHRVDRRGFLGALGGGAFGAMASTAAAAGEAARNLRADPKGGEAYRPISDRKVRFGIVGYGVCQFGAKFGMVQK